MGYGRTCFSLQWETGLKQNIYCSKRLSLIAHIILPPLFHSQFKSHLGIISLSPLPHRVLPLGFPGPRLGLSYKSQSVTISGPSFSSSQHQSPPSQCPASGLEGSLPYWWERHFSGGTVVVGFTDHIWFHPSPHSLLGVIVGRQQLRNCPKKNCKNLCRRWSCEGHLCPTGMARLGAARLARARLWGSVEHQAPHIQPVPEHGLGTLLPP